MSRNTGIAIVGVLILSIVGTLPVFAGAAGTAKTIELETNGNVDNFVSNDADADDDVLVTVHDADQAGSGPLFVTIDGNDDGIGIRLTEVGGSAGHFEGSFTVVDTEGEVSTQASGILLAGDLNASDTTVDVDDTTDFDGDQLILVESEEMTVVSILTNTRLIVARGANGTTAVAHADNTAVDILDALFSGSALTDTVTNTATTIPVSDGTDFNKGMKLRIQGAGGGAAEQLTVRDIDSNVLTVTRGVSGTTAAALAGNTRVYILLSVFEEDDRDELTVKYDVSGGISVSQTTTVDSEGPKISDIFPAADAFLKASPIVFSAAVTDAGVGMGKKDNVTVNTRFDVGGVGLSPASLTEQATDGVWDVSISLSLVEGAYTWKVSAADLVGNTTQEPSSGDFDLTVDRTAPEIVKAFTGFKWDRDNKKVKTDERDSIAVLFQKAGSSGLADLLAASTLSASDFKVVGSTIKGLVFPGLEGGPTADNDANLGAMESEIEAALDVEIDGSDDETRFLVFITLEDDLASDAEPNVQIFAGGIEDLAGNDNSSQVVKAADKIHPRLTVTITGEASSRPVVQGRDKHKFTVRVAADEPLNNDNPPTVKLVSLRARSVAQGDGITKVQVDQVHTIPSSKLDLVATNTWEATLDGNDPDWATEGNFSGLVVAFVEGTDKNGNTTSIKGVSEATQDKKVDLSDAAKAGALIEWDTGLVMSSTKFELRPAKSGTTDETESKNPFVVINFAEKAEYEIDVDDDDDGNLDGPEDKLDDTEIDTHDTVTLTSLTLDGVDVLGQISKVDDDSFVVALSGLGLGEYKLLCTAVDEVGNKVDDDDCKFEFEVKKRGKYQLPLNPGWNLVSLPSTPGDPAIGSVIPPDHPAAIVLTYEAGEWKTSVRGADGNWEGAITAIDSLHAYWVLTGALDGIETLIPEGDPMTIPPAIQVIAGWNLLPVIDVRQSKAGTGINADQYLASIDWTVAYTYDTDNDAWIELTPGEPGDSDEVKTGKGYWVWVTTKGTLFP